MFHRHDFSNLSATLAHVCFSDNVILALARTISQGAVQPEDRELISDTEKFFDKVLSGYTWSETPVLSRQSVQAAAAFTDAVHAFPVAPPADFQPYVNQLRETVRTILTDGTAPENEIRTVQKFFTQSAYSRLEQFNALVSEKPKYTTWRPSATR